MHLREAQHFIESAPGYNADPEARVTLYQTCMDMAEIHFYRHEDTQTLHYLTRALDVLPADDIRQTDVLFRTALVYDTAGRDTEAIDTYLQSYYSARKSAGNPLTGAILYNLASLYREQGNFSQAQETLHLCLTYDKQTGSAADVFRSFMLLTRIREEQAQLNGALESCNEALSAARSINDSVLVTEALLKQARLYEALQNWTAALSSYRAVEAAASQQLTNESQAFLMQKIQFTPGELQ